MRKAACDGQRMQKAKLVLVLIVMVAMLPWGNLVPKFGHRAPGDAVVAQAPATEAQQLRAAPARGLCKGAMLPGATCHQAYAVLTQAVGLRVTSPFLLALPEDWVIPPCHQPAVFLTPPRTA